MPLGKICDVTAATTGQLEAIAPQLAELPLLQSYGLDAVRMRERLLRAHAAKEGLLVATRRGEQALLGLAWYQTHGGFAVAPYLRLLAVVPGAGGKGVGGALLQHFEAANAAGLGGHLLLCNAKNVGALQFYDRAGYRRVGELPDFARAGETEVILRKVKGAGGGA